MIRYRYATLSSVQMLDRTTCAGAHWLGGRWRTRSMWWGSSWRCRSPRCRGPASRRRGRGCCPHSVSAAGWASSLHLPAKCVGFEPGLQMFLKFTIAAYWGNVTHPWYWIQPFLLSVPWPPSPRSLHLQQRPILKQAVREDVCKARSELSRDPEATEVVGGRTAGCYRARVTVVTRVPHFLISILSYN